MIRCPSCATENPDSNRFCGSCATPLTEPVQPASQVPTLAQTAGGTFLPSNSKSEEGRFVPGTLLLDRYRITGLVARGGMGEVYRATDLKLGQQVALKFLPEEMARNPQSLARFQNEVRLARQVSHPNVCRVYDIGEMFGQPFLSMEYVDGEDLGSLLRRIGRLPADKALEIARKLCAGLAAAHDQGVLHRDLKPSNIMIDSRGQVLITDFGLATLAGKVRGGDLRSGTPEYMSPEQLAGKEVTERSDVYALGLVLYEMFTGRRAFEAKNLEELKRLQQQAALLGPPGEDAHVNPAVERVILRCLKADPRQRPASALAVSAALPGGDPLLAALAAGETPSPAVVAASGEHEGLRPAVALTCLVSALVLLAAVVYLSSRVSILARTPLDRSPEILASHARDVARRLGYPEHPADDAHGFFYDFGYLRYLEREDQSADRWNKLASAEPPAVLFWHRESPRPLEAGRFLGAGIATGRVTMNDPPFDSAGMITLTLDSRGRLRSFLAMPKQVDEPVKDTPAPNWRALFEAARLDQSKFTSAEPFWTPLMAFDTRAAWVGAWPGMPANALRIEAAAWRGRPVSFQVIEPWTRPQQMEPFRFSAGERASRTIFLLLGLLAIAGACLMARRNIRLKRGDTRGAWRLAFFVVGLQLLSWLCLADHVLTYHEFALFVMCLSWALLVAGFLWLLYMALEPHVRRRWPQTMVSWSRILAGEFRDSVVGRDLLVGLLFGFVWYLLASLPEFLGNVLHGPRPDLLGSARNLAGGMIDFIPGSAGTALLYFFLLFILRAVLRKEWLAGVAFVLVFLVMQILRAHDPLRELPPVVAIYTAIVVVLTRFGLAPLVVAILVEDLLRAVPFTMDFSAWYLSSALAPVLILLLLTLYAFRVSLGKQKLITGELLDW
jgi:serine/threonine-protein kinase